MQTRTRKSLALLAGGILITASHFAIAQQGGYGGAQGDAPGQAPPAQQNFDEATLERFAGAWSEVQGIREEYMGEIQAAGDQEQAQALQQEAQSKMVEAVTDAGVEVGEYNAIATRMGQDPEFAEQVMAMAEEE